MLKTDPSDQPIRSVSRRQIHRTSQSEAFPEDKTRFRLVQLDQSGRTLQVGCIIIRTRFRLVHSDSFGENFRRTIFVSSNHIPRKNFRTNFRRTIFTSSNHIFRPDFRTNFRRTNFISSNRILRTDFRTNFRRNVFRLVLSDVSAGYQTVKNGHSLRSHPQDRMVRPPSLSRFRAKAVPRTHKAPRAHRALTRKDVFNHPRWVADALSCTL